MRLYCYAHKIFDEMILNNHWDEKIPTDAAIISIINSPGIAMDDEKHILPSSSQVLNLEFDDVTPEDNIKNCVLFTEQMAKQSYNFIVDNINHDRNFFIHCSAGLSRSQAFVKFINDMWPEYNWQTRLENPCRFPNWHVVSMLKQEYYKHNF